MLQSQLLADLAGRIASGAGYARALVDGAWVRCEKYNASASGSVACVDFLLPGSGQVTRVRVYAPDGSLWADREESFALEDGAGRGNIYRLRCALSQSGEG